LSARDRLGVYEVTALIGEGGMGQVYRARDTKLNRDVALKILPDAFASNPDRLARFTREAQTLAALNHPNIAHIHGFEETGGVHALVMELVEGEDLSQRIARGAIPVAEALPIAKQIADALEAAHEQGIVHRDLKPGNVKVRDDGTVKVLDFGLAKALEPAVGAGASATMSPTITTPAMTQMGMILGTAAYMSPEQAKGRPADKRSDIWSFGCVLYEMLTAKRAFEGDDVSDTRAAVLRGQPDWSALPGDLPEPIRLLLYRCLEKDRSRRTSDIGIARFLITEPSLATGPHGAPAPQPVSPPLWKRAVILTGSAAAGAALLGIALWTLRSPVPPATVTRFSYRLADDQRFTNQGRHVLAISPDGTRMAYVANQRLYLKTMWDADARPLSGQQSSGITSPVFSPDGQWIAYWTSGMVNKVAITGGAPVKLSDVDNPFGMSWNGDSLLIGQGDKGIVRVPDKGGPPEAVIRVKDSEIAHGPQLLPDGRSILFTLASGAELGRWDSAQIVVQTIGSTDRKTIIRGGTDARYVRTGHILYAVEGVLFAEPFDIRKLESVGGPTSVVDGVARANGIQTGTSQSAVSGNGTLIYVSGPATTSAQGGSEIAWLDLKGKVERLKLSPRAYQSPRVSPDGQQLAVGVDDGRTASIWVYDLDAHTQIRQLTSEGNNRFPVWTPDGARITFQSDREGDRSIFWQRADGKGPAEPLIKAAQGEALMPESWSPDGETLLFSARTGARPFALRTFTVHDKRNLAFGDIRSNSEPQAGFSKDGHWVAYALGSGPGSSLNSVYVRPFPINDELHLIAPGISPFWARDSMRLYFVSSPGVAAYSVVNVITEPVFGASERSAVPRPSVVGGGPNLPRAYDIAPDGQHLILLTAPESSGTAVAAAQIHVVLNWTEELKARVPTK
jgi:serine/threonine-protein kinase